MPPQAFPKHQVSALSPERGGEQGHGAWEPPPPRAWPLGSVPPLPPPSAAPTHAPAQEWDRGLMSAGRLEKVDERGRDRADRRPVISRRAGLSAIAGSRAGSPRGRHRLPGRRARRFPRSAGPGAFSARRGRARHRREGRAIIMVIARLPARPRRLRTPGALAVPGGAGAPQPLPPTFPDE